MAFLALEKNRKRFPISVCARERDHSRPHSLNRENKGAYTLAMRSKPEGTVKTVSLKMRQFLPLLRQDIGQI